MIQSRRNVDDEQDASARPPSSVPTMLAMGNMPEYTGGTDPLVYLVTTADRLAELDCRCCSLTATLR